MITPLYKKKTLIFTLLIILLIIISGGCSSMYNSDTKNGIGNSSNNLLRNYGHVAFQGDWFYYSSDIERHDKLFKSKKDGTENSLIYEVYSGADSAYDINYIQVVGDWIYFSYGDIFYKIKNDGSKLTELISFNNYSPAQAYVIGDYIYFIDSVNLDASTEAYNLERMSTKGTNRMVLISGIDFCEYKTSNISIILFNEDSIYFTETGNIWKMKIEDGNLECLSKDVEFPKLKNKTMVDDEMFYWTIEDNFIADFYKININTNEILKLFEHEAGKASSTIFDYDNFEILNVANNRYIGTLNGKLTSFSKDFTDYSNINNDNAYSIYIDNDDNEWIYYHASRKLCRVRIDGSKWEEIDFYKVY